MDDKSFTMDQTLAAQGCLRALLHLPKETFPLKAFIGMISDEIEKMREAGYSDDKSAELISDAMGVCVTGSEIARYYVGHDERDGRATTCHAATAVE